MSTTASSTVLAGLIGAGIQASRTPALHEREGLAHGLRYTYQLLDLDALQLDTHALPDLLLSAERQGFNGLNITYPCKQLVLPLLDELSPQARCIGAVNTVVFTNGKRIGHNTDCLGFAEGFRRSLSDVAVEHVVQMGAGGAGAAVAHALLDEDVQHLQIFDVDHSRAHNLVDNLNQHFPGQRATVGTDLTTSMAQANGLVNTTPVGMAKLPGMPVPATLLHKALWVAEIIYFPLQTELLRTARALGCRTLDGRQMAVFQAVSAFGLISGATADASRMLAHFEEMNNAVQG